jgi:sugar lactone lactonase YvrE
MGTRLLCVALVFVAACTCGNGNNTPDARPDAFSDAPPADARPIDAPVADADIDADEHHPDAIVDGPTTIDAAPDAGVDAMFDAMLPDAPPTCTLPPFTLGVSTVAGCDLFGAVDGTRDVARFHNPVNVAVAADGMIYVADFDNNRVRRVTPTGTVSTIVQQVGFERPFGLAFDATGQLYVQTDRNSSGMHSTMTGTIWRVDLVVGGATVVVENIGRPRGMAVLGDGRIATADYLHHVVQIVDPVAMTVTPLAGTFDMPGFADDTGAAARFNRPYGVVILLDGSIAVAEIENHRIRRVALDGTTTTIAGTGVPGNTNGTTGTATFNGPQDLEIDSTGTLYVADTNNFVIRRITGGNVDTIIGAGIAGYLDSDNLTTAQIFGLEGIALSPFDGKLYIADGTRGEDINPHNRIRVAILP